MAIWDSLLRRVVDPIVEQAIRESKDKQVAKGLVAYSTQASFYPTNPKEDITMSKPFSQGVKFDTLRDFSRVYPILRSCVNYRKRQMSQLAWGVSPAKVTTEKPADKEKDQMNKDAEIIKEFLKYPTGDRTMSFSSFISKIIEDLIVLDAVAVYRRKNRRGGFYGYLPVDASTIELIVNADGTTPTPPEPAYQQRISSVKEPEKLTTDELIYKLMNSRTDSPYGQSPVETLILVVTTALKLQTWNLAYLTEGNVPEGFIELPKDVASDPQQLKLWQESWDAMFSGDPRFQRKIKFLPEGMTWHPIKKQEDLQFERFEKWLLLQTCSLMDVPPQAIGFQFERGKGATEAEYEIGKERGLYPLANFLKEIIDEMIHYDLGHPELQFVWLNVNPTDKKEEADVFGQLVRTGALSVDEYRIKQGYEPIGLGQYIMTPVGPIMVEDFVEQSEKGKNPFIPVPKPAKVPGITTETTATPTQENSKQKDIADKIRKATNEEVIQELKRWKKSALNDLKQSKDYRDFKTDIIDYRTQGIIKDGLRSAQKRQDVEELFGPFISQENRIITAMLDLYDEVNSINPEESATTRTS